MEICQFLIKAIVSLFESFTLRVRDYAPDRRDQMLICSLDQQLSVTNLVNYLLILIVTAVVRVLQCLCVAFTNFYDDDDHYYYIDTLPTTRTTTGIPTIILFTYLLLVIFVVLLWSCCHIIKKVVVATVVMSF